MFLSIFVYTFTALILYVLGTFLVEREARYHLRGHKGGFWSPEMIGIILVFVLVAALRFKVGSDYGTYARQYIALQNFGYFDRESFEWGFTAVSTLLAKMGLHFCFFFAFWAFIQIFFFYYGLKDRKYLYPYVGLALMLTPYFVEWMNGLRQCVVCCLFVYLVLFIQQRKFIPYAIGVLLGTLIHKSALLLLFVYFIPFHRIHLSHRGLNILILVMFVILGNISSWYGSLAVVSNVSEFLGYDKYTESMAELVSEGRNMTWGPIRLLLLFTDVLIIWFYPKVKSVFRDDNMLEIYFILFYVGVCLENLFVMAGILFSRPTMYFTTFGLVMIAYTLCGLRRIGAIRGYYCFMFVACSYIYLALFKLYLSGTLETSVIQYRFIFLENNILQQLYI